MNTEEQIVIFREFDSVIQANIIKSKLDAFDIPCFLSEESLANLYPSMPILSIGVRLHVFQKDIVQANAILEEQNLSISEGSEMCPHCGSSHIENEDSNRINRMIKKTFAFIFGSWFSFPEKNKCLRCGEEF